MANDDYVQKMREALNSFPMNTSNLENLAKSQADLAEKLSSTAIEAAQRSADLSARWAQDMLSKLPTLTQARTEPAEYTKAAGEFMSGSADTAAENLAAFAEIARKVQAETLAVLLSAGKDLSQDPAAAGQTTAAPPTNKTSGT